jgi:serine/threonine protein kinase
MSIVVTIVRLSNSDRFHHNSGASGMGACLGCFSHRPIVSGDAEEETLEPQYRSFTDFFVNSSDRRIGSYVFESHIGQGAASHVYRAIDERDNATVAVKIYSQSRLLRRTLGPEEPLVDSVRREIDLMDSLKHRYIISLVDVFVENVTQSLMLVMPFAARGTLQKLLDSGDMNSEDFPVCFLEIAEAFRYLHGRNIVHRDLKPDNILCFRSDYYVVSDFSISMELSSPDEMLDDTKGSPAFLSPEECSGEEFRAKPADVWAFGVTVYRSVFGYFPFNIESAQGREVVSTIIAVKELLDGEELAFPNGADEKVVGLLRATLEKDPDKRATFEEIVGFEWFAEARVVDEANRIAAEEYAETAEE